LFIQYRRADVKETDDLIKISGISVRKTRVMNVGMSINEIKNLDIKRSAYTVDFYIWFRYEGKFDETEITFLNALKPVSLGDPVKEIKTNDITTRAYHVVADFSSVLDFHAYPFEDHTLYVRLRHKDMTKDQLILNPDTTKELPDGLEKKDVGTTRLTAVTGWMVRDINFHQDIISNTSMDDSAFADMESRIKYSRFNGTIRIERSGMGIILKNFLPILAMILILYAMHFMPSDQIVVRMIVFIGVVFYKCGLQSETFVRPACGLYHGCRICVSGGVCIGCRICHNIRIRSYYGQKRIPDNRKDS